jgi:hypothetical protein
MSCAANKTLCRAIARPCPSIGAGEPAASPTARKPRSCAKKSNPAPATRLYKFTDNLCKQLSQCLLYTTMYSTYRKGFEIGQSEITQKSPGFPRSVRALRIRVTADTIRRRLAGVGQAVAAWGLLPGYGVRLQPPRQRPEFESSLLIPWHGLQLYQNQLRFRPLYNRVELDHQRPEKIAPVSAVNKLS